MEQTKPFQPSDLAAWSIGYISQRVKELAGIEALIVSFTCDQTGKIFEYTLNSVITIGYSRYGMIQRYKVPDLLRGYHGEWLDHYADRYIHDYQKTLERLREE